MLTRGLLTRARSLPKFLRLGILFALLLLIYTYLKRGITSINSSQVNTADNPSMIYTLLLNTGLNETLSKYATSQSAFETAFWTSSLYRSNNNCFGMKYDGQYNATGEKNGYADYKNIINSIADFVAWYSTKRSSIFSLPLYIGSLSSYVKFLKNNNYFEADEAVYLQGCQNYYTQIFG